ncbi:hypothetical protein RRX38_19775 [Pseudomonas sp. DTU_2021_1001937_2_SI_NGA_ILE_001]|uniref:hypothetical protein n=1 Tax=Pseudomonas sp. DTU_2021_1001937_2_SI_NGA_ILE_001 TaxID=3077589 RepID=UPI0025D50690|nr:hypothetical protein [Pseudomonas sp. DTU_2021_1001937_2_SI_NGA_ILE_001]WNW13302.1 hypothetical protein RRX38_19775 [Pseudomonas sp. DTU_2021_1001937_2_SI_NGA_ILE_001]
MTELQHTVVTPELYERLINRLGLALETASTAGRLRDEMPEELELDGLSNAEFELIEAYLEKGARAANGAVEGMSQGSCMASPERSVPVEVSQDLARVIWLKDKRRANTVARPGRYSQNTFKF